MEGRESWVKFVPALCVPGMSPSQEASLKCSSRYLATDSGGSRSKAGLYEKTFSWNHLASWSSDLSYSMW